MISKQGVGGEDFLNSLLGKKLQGEQKTYYMKKSKQWGDKNFKKVRRPYSFNRYYRIHVKQLIAGGMSEKLRVRKVLESAQLFEIGIGNRVKY